MSAISAERVARSFRRSFASYHAATGPQARIAEHLAARLAALGAPARFAQGFEIGCGTGHLTQALKERFEFDRLTLNDLTEGACATAKLHGAEFTPGDARDCGWPPQPDLIASASMIQWLEAPGALVAQAARALAPGGWLAISGFGPAQFHELARLGSDARAPGLIAAQHLADALPQGVEILDLGERQEVLWFDTPRDVLRHLRETGVNGAASQVWTRARLARFDSEYRALFGIARGVPLTYHPIWMIARR
ncbi:methyltransferase domain-containing protein [Sinirhodobacter sp. WL0062]|uniref:Methyltransferase domain-containing protein n=1 Tax=Rhodobacter flavimaris TaxID=2907145 RepID=A0ABS8YTJ4_9RHOB|nr:methyltransferase domain-containing protein [Sinirhodobacter sp. WL0062]MCE5973186.1 methyltransferase domain-containing protein [Sinirhodobacter sp. WL0062]